MYSKSPAARLGTENEVAVTSCGHDPSDAQLATGCALSVILACSWGQLTAE
jgi:hypothetical protein